MHVEETLGTPTTVSEYLLVEETGQLTLGSAAGSGAINTISGSAAVLFENHGLVSGSGSFGRDSTWLNYGMIEANLPGRELDLVTAGYFSSTSPRGINRGTLRATSGGILDLSLGIPINGMIDNDGGLIVANVGSSVEIGRIVLEGGTLRAVADETAAGTLTLQGTTLVDVSLEGDIQSYGFSLGGEIEITGTVTLDENTQATIYGDTTLSGGGAWQLNQPTTFLSSTNSGSSLPLTQFINQDNTLRGGMLISLDETAFVNRGLLETIDQSNGIRFIVGEGGVVNSGTIRAISRSVTLEGAGLFQNFEQETPGLIEALPGSEIVLFGPTVQGGVLRAHPADGELPAGEIRNSNSQTELRDLTIEGLYDSTQTFSKLAGQIDNRGTMSGDFEVATDVTLSGGGTLEWNELRGGFADIARQLTNLDHTIRGTGVVNGSLRLVNAGTIEAASGNQDWNDAPVRNTGLLQATTRGQLIVGHVENDGGTIHAAVGSQVIVDGITGGIVTTEGTGRVVVTGPLTQIFNQGAMQLSSGLTLAGDINNDGTMEVTTGIRLEPGVTRLAGTGAMEFNGRGSLSQLVGPGTFHLINETGHTLAGRVFIDVVSGQFHNRGAVVSTSGATSIIEMGGGASLVQEGLLHVRDASRMNLDLAAAEWTNRGTVLVEEGTLDTLVTTTRNASGAEIHVHQGSRLQTPRLVNEPGGLIGGAGLIDLGTGTSVDNVLHNSGALAPGDSTGTLDLDGHLVQSEFGTLVIEIGGVHQGQFDRLSIFGNATLDGKLEVSLADDYTPMVGSTFEILTTFGGGTTPGRLGAFADTALPPLSDDLAWNLTYGVNFVRLAVILPGDYNADGTVNAADYAVWRDNLGSPVSLPNDNTPGVDEGDYAVWRTNYGAASPAVASVLRPVPEPSGIAMCLLSLGGATVIAFIRPRELSIRSV